MFKIIKDSFKITNKYIILATPLILFSLISSLYLLFSANGSQVGILFAIILFFLMLGAFLSGWLYMTKKCITNPENDDINTLITDFPSGVGEYFLSICGVLIISVVICAVLAAAGYAAGVKLFGDIKPMFQALANASSSTETLKTYIMGLSTNELIQLNKWNALIFFTAAFSHCLLMFYTPVIFFKTKNPLKALFISVKDLLSRKFFRNIFLFVTIVASYMFISIISTIAASNIFLHFIMTLLNFYYIVFVVILLYNYYYQTFIQIGANIDTRV